MVELIPGSIDSSLPIRSFCRMTGFDLKVLSSQNNGLQWESYCFHIVIIIIITSWMSVYGACDFTALNLQYISSATIKSCTARTWVFKLFLVILWCSTCLNIWCRNLIFFKITYLMWIDIDYHQRISVN